MLLIDVLKYAVALRHKAIRREAMDMSPRVKEAEEQLSAHSSKTNDPQAFLGYVGCVGQVFATLWAFNAEFEGLRWWVERRRRSSEDRMCERMKHKFGRDFFLALGNWGERRQAKGQPPSMTKGIRKVLTRNGIKVVLVDEYRTSKKCYGCQHGTTAHFINHMKKPMKMRSKLMRLEKTELAQEKKRIAF